jgi:nucleotide-binding universal stress UspA family protein
MKTQINSILIPTDFSVLSESAIKVGIAIAKRQNAQVTLLHVVDLLPYLLPTEVLLSSSKEVLSRKEEELKELSEKIQKDTGVKAVVKVLEGTPSDSICKLAYEENISLIVMGTHGVSGLREFFIGSEAFRVIKNATCPVLTIPGGWQKTDFEKVLFPVRLRPGTLDTYFYARPIIEKNNSELFFLGLYEQKKDLVEEEISISINRIKLQLDNDKVVFKSESSQSKDFPAKTIEMAMQYEADLIILTANLDHDFKAYFVGPFVQQVVNHSRLPVLCIKPKFSVTGQNIFVEPV